MAKNDTPKLRFNLTLFYLNKKGIQLTVLLSFKVINALTYFKVRAGTNGFTQKCNYYKRGM